MPAKLNDAQQTVKQNADNLNTESKRLLVASAQEKNETEKLKLLTLSAKAGNAAVEQLSRLIPEKPALVKTNKTTNNTKAAGSDTNELDKIGSDLAAVHRRETA